MTPSTPDWSRVESRLPRRYGDDPETYIDNVSLSLAAPQVRG